MIKILIAEDHHIVREGLVALLEKHGEFEIVGQAEDGITAVKLCKELKPDVLLLDIGMPKMNGIEVLNEVVKNIKLPTEVVILSMYSDPTIVRQAFKKGARGYLLKRSVTEELALAVKSAANREIFISPSIAHIMMDDSVIQRFSTDTLSPFALLTHRERQVLQLIAEGRTNKENALLLGVSERTVEKHRANLMQKLDVGDVASLVKIAIKYRLISIED